MVSPLELMQNHNIIFCYCSVLDSAFTVLGEKLREKLNWIFKSMN